jgi:alpha-D-xyloside xylohydrolase
MKSLPVVRLNSAVTRIALTIATLLMSSQLVTAEERIATWVESRVMGVPGNTGTELAVSTVAEVKAYVQVIPYSENTFRVIISPSDELSGPDSLVAIAEPTESGVQLTTEGEISRLTSAAGSVSVNSSNGEIVVLNAAGDVILKTPELGSFRFDSSFIEGETGMRVIQRFILGDEAVYGLGQFYDDSTMNWRGKTRALVQGNHHAINPTIVSTNGWGIYWDNYSKTIFRDGHDGMSFSSEVADQIDFYVFLGDDIDALISAYRNLTGTAPMFPRWAFGYFQSKQRYMSDEDLLFHARKFRELEIPIDVIVQDWQYWGDDRGNWSSMEFDASKFADPQATIDEIHNELNLQLLISIWPILGDKSELFAEMDKNGWLSDGEVSWIEGAKLYDAFQPEARELYWKYIRDGLMKYGIDALWMDATEPERAFTTDREATEPDIKKWGPTYLGSRSRYLNPYSLMTNEGVYNGWRRDIDDKRVVILTRSAFAGQQRTGAITWSGDIFATWEVLHDQIAAGLNYSLSGLPYWTFDIGGFFVDDGPFGLFDGFKGDYGELYVRWFEMGAFLPVFRSHGDHRPREPWQFGAEGDVYYDTLIKYLNLRYRLLPYIYSWSWKVTSENSTMLRALSMDFAADRQTWNINDQFMLGSDLLVAPVYTPTTQGDPKDGGTSNRVVYLPAGVDWTNFWTGETLEGGQTIDMEIDVATIPLFVRSGAIIPMGPFVQYSTENLDGPLEIRIYPGNDGRFTVYEDANDGYGYENGEHATITIDWDDANRTLTVSDREGSYPGMTIERTLNVVLAEEGTVAGFQPAQNPDRTLRYRGERLVERF